MGDGEAEDSSTPASVSSDGRSSLSGSPYHRWVIDFTDRAIEILSKAEQAAKRFNAEARIRLVRDGNGVKFELTDGPDATDTAVERGGFTLFAQVGLEGVVDVVEPHDRLILRPPGDPEPSVRGAH